MANNANINKVIYGNDTLIDLTGDTVTQADVLNSKSFHDASGTLRTGTADISVKADLTDLAPAFSTSINYTSGQYVTYDGDMYRFIATHSAGAWNSNHVEKITVARDLIGKQNNLSFDTTDFSVFPMASVDYDLNPYSVALNKSTSVTWADDQVVTGGAVYSALATKADVSKVIPYFSLSTSYKKGDYVSSNGSSIDGVYRFYRFTADHPAGAWSGFDVEEITIKDALADKIAWTDNTLLGAKNILPQYIYVGTKMANGVTFTADSEGIVTCSGTSSAVTTWRAFITLKAGSYKIYGGENIPTKAGENVFVALYNSTSTQYYTPDTGTDDTYTFANDTEVGYTLRIGNGVDSSSYVFKPMLYYASDTDATFAPYTKTNRELTTNSVTWDDAEKSVKKNLIPFPYAEGTQGSRTTNGVSFFLDKDGTIRTSGTCNNSNGATFYLWQNGIPDWLESGVDYVLTGCPSGGSTSTYMIQYNNWTEGASYQVHDVGDGVLLRKITDSTTQKLRIWIKNGVNANGLVFKPMIRKATVLDTNYERGIPDNTEVMTWKANTKLGAKNRNKSESSFVFVKSTARYKSFYMDDVSATNEQNFRVSFDYSAISGYSGSTTALYVRFGNGTGNASDAQVTLDATSGHFEKILPCPANTNNLYCFIPSTEADNATITISNVMIYPADDTDDTYAPYSMTNRELTDKVFEKRELTSADNLDNITETGIYSVSTAPTNMPDGKTYCTVIVKYRTSGNIVQEVIASNALYTRQYGGSPASWSAWTSYAKTASPALTGTPTAPTATAGTNTTQIATTAFVQTAIDNAVTSALSASY